MEDKKEILFAKNSYVLEKDNGPKKPDMLKFEKFNIKEKGGSFTHSLYIKDDLICFVECYPFAPTPKAPEKITEFVMEFMEEKGILPELDLEKITPSEICDNLNRLGLVISKDGMICSLYNLPEGFETLEGIPHLCDLAMPEGVKIPDNLTVHGDFILDPKRESLMVKGLKVDGKIFAESLKRVSLDVPTEALIITEEDVSDFKYKSATVREAHRAKDSYAFDVPKIRSRAQAKNLKISGNIPLNIKVQKTK